jgi:hypothetical protein
MSPSGSQEDPRVRTARKVVFALACVVGLSMVTAFVFAAYSFATERPAKELFLGSD